MPPIAHHLFELETYISQLTCRAQVGGALVKTLLELSLRLKVPVVNGLCFRGVSAGDASALSGKLARGAVHMANMRDGSMDSYAGNCRRWLVRGRLDWLTQAGRVRMYDIYEGKNNTSAEGRFILL